MSVLCVGALHTRRRTSSEMFGQKRKICKFLYSNRNACIELCLLGHAFQNWHVHYKGSNKKTSAVYKLKRGKQNIIMHMISSLRRSMPYKGNISSAFF